MEKGLDALAQVRQQIGVPVLTDIHDITSIERIAQVVDVLQVPALLCRQTDLIQEAAKYQLPLNIN